MKRFGVAISLALILITGCASRQALQGMVGLDPAARGEELPGIFDGVYTVQQARWGERTAQLSCFQCHSATEWAHPRFVDASSGGNVVDLYRVMRSTMPPGDPGRLRDDQYANLLAYILKLNGAPTGEAELPSDPEKLQRVIAPDRDYGGVR